jgi:hypothetical protein
VTRRSEGLKLVRRDSGLYYARFTHAGRRYDIATGESDLAPAQVAAAKIYGNVVAGRWAPGGRQAAPTAGAPFDEVAARWLAHIRASIDEKTFRLYRDTYVRSHFAPFFKTIDRLTTVGAQDYIAARLRKVTRGARSSTSCRLSVVSPSGRTPAGTWRRCRRSRPPATASSARQFRTRASVCR